MSSAPWNAEWHLNAELARILDGLAQQLRRQRQRGRTAAGDAVRGLVIEEGEEVRPQTTMHLHGDQSQGADPSDEHHKNDQ